MRGNWTGACTIILSGIRLGHGVLCVAGSVVTKDTPCCSIVGGVPTRVLGYVDPVTGERISLFRGELSFNAHLDS